MSRTDSVDDILIISGKPAFSTFALSKKRAAAPQLCYAEHVHVLKLRAPLDDAERQQVDRLLDYGPNQQWAQPCGERFITVMPV